jgi:hypothetical protein
MSYARPLNERESQNYRTSVHRAANTGWSRMYEQDCDSIRPRAMYAEVLSLASWLILFLWSCSYCLLLDELIWFRVQHSQVVVTS